MYIPKLFDEPRIEIMYELIRSQPLATLVTVNLTGPEANHIPLVLVDQPAPYGVLRGHVARANPLWQEHPEKTDVLAIFHGPNSYITPSWYASKADHGKVVPTWNYVAVHASGRLRVIEDVRWIRDQLDALTAHNETGFAHRWQVSDAPHEFTEKLIESIVGIEITITALKGKWKASQNRPLQDRASVVEGLKTRGHDEMAALVQSRNSS
jgi:transcriptional regulator